MRTGTSQDAANEVHLVGTVSAVLEERTLPSGDVLLPLRVVVPRRAATRRGTSAGDVPRSRAVVDVIDVACWSAATRRAARLAAGDAVQVDGSLHRRFFRAGPGVQSRYEVRADRLRRLSDGRNQPP